MLVKFRMLHLACHKAGTCLILNRLNGLPVNITQLEIPTLGGHDGIAIRACVEECLVAKGNANKTARYIKSLGYYLRQFSAGREERPISDFTFSDVEAWLAKYPSAYTRQTWLNRLSTLFAFAVRRGHIPGNPCDRLERITVDKPAPLILTPAQSHLLLSAAPVVMRPYIVLGLFAGLRPEEITRLDWSHIDLNAGTVLALGKRRRRLVTLEPLAVTHLAKHPLRIGPVAPSNSTIDRWRVTARSLLGLPRWPQDLLRHTAASYLLALLKDAGKVATRLGNSVRVLQVHYLNPVTDQDCAEFWLV